MQNRSDYDKNGSILVLVLVIIASMTILSFGLAYRTRIDIKLAHSNALRAQAYHLALGGIERIKVHLTDQIISGSGGELVLRIAKNCPFNSSAHQEGLINHLQNDIKMPNSLEYTLADENAFFNLNTSNPFCWLTFNAISATEQVSIVDWIDEDNEISIFEGATGAETDFYRTVQPSYGAKNKPCALLKEMLFIRDIDHRKYLGEDLNHNSILDGNENDENLSKPSDNGDNVLNQGLTDIFTVYGDGKININTASLQILAALFTGHQEDASAAENIISYRECLEEDACFMSIEDIEKIPGLTEKQIGLLSDSCGFTSEYFRIFSYTRIRDSIDCCLMATVKQEEGQLKILCIERLI